MKNDWKASVCGREVAPYISMISAKKSYQTLTIRLSPFYTIQLICRRNLLQGADRQPRPDSLQRKSLERGLGKPRALVQGKLSGASLGPHLHRRRQTETSERGRPALHRRRVQGARQVRNQKLAALPGSVAA